MPSLLATTLQTNLLYGVAAIGFLAGSWFLGRAITVITKGNNPLVWRGWKKMFGLKKD
ncbi:MAG TPA: hypothetical protein QF700_01675 [Prochlorococcus sp.]|nr:hypothetical protein [Prochlorococcus sp.]|tara:strand:+ start:202 stop:375 length:174 start_codon:yes stop_codon:yes gene_type:complete